MNKYDVIRRKEAVSLMTRVKHNTMKAETAIDELERLPNPLEIENKGIYQCFHCLNQTVVWDSDFDYADYGYEGEGIVHVCHCANCGAEIEYKCPC